MKKLLAVLLSVLMLFSLVGCTTAEPEAAVAVEPVAAADESEAMQDVTITFMASQDWLQDAEIALGEKFTEETGITVDYQIVPSDQYINLLLTKLNAGEGPDLFGGQSGATDIVTQLNVETNAVSLSDEAWAATVDPLAAEQLTAGGKRYGQPMQDVSNVWAVAYNTKIFADLGLEIPTTFDEFKDVCEAIKAAGITPVYECVSDGWHHVLWFPELGPVYEKSNPGLAAKLNGNEATFAGNETMTTVLDQIKEMVDLGYWGKNYMSNEYANGAASIADGSYAMFIANQGFGAEVNAINPDIAVEDIGYFVMPLADNQIININPAGPSRFVYSGGKNVDAAKAYLEFMARPESIQYMIENVPKNNTLPFTTAKDMYNNTIKEFYARYAERGTVYQVAVNYLNPQWMDLGKDITAIIIGDMTADDMLTNIDARRAEQASAVGDAAWAK